MEQADRARRPAQHDPRGRQYFWIASNAGSDSPEPGSDIEAIRDGYVSVTPLHYDLTDEEALRQVEGWDWSTVAGRILR